MDMLRAMKTFVSVAEQGSLTAAARTQEKSLASVVRTLAALEKQLGIVLVQRTTRRTRVTEEGYRYLEQCRTILGLVAQSGEQVSTGTAELRGKLTVTASVLFGRQYIAPIVNTFLARHPGTTVDLLLLDRVVNLIEEGADVAVRIGPLVDTNLTAVRVGQVRRVVCASPKFLKQHGRPLVPGDVRALPTVRHTGLDPRPEWMFRGNKRGGLIPIAPVLTTNQIDAALEACEFGLGLGRFLSYQAAPARSRGRLVYVLEDFEIEPVPIHIVFLPAKPRSARVRTFVDACVNELRRARFD
jgi:DNA-binding transcriptional LysR family regulator